MGYLEEKMKKQWQNELKEENEEIVKKKEMFLIHYKSKIVFYMTAATLISLLITASHILSKSHSSVGMLFATWIAFSLMLWASIKRVSLYKQIKEKDPDQMTLDERRFFLLYK